MEEKNTAKDAVKSESEKLGDIMSGMTRKAMKDCKDQGVTFIPLDFTKINPPPEIDEATWKAAALAKSSKQKATKPTHDTSEEKSSATPRARKRKPPTPLSTRSTPQTDQSGSKPSKRSKLGGGILNADYIKEEAKDEDNDPLSIDDMLEAQSTPSTGEASKSEANLQQTVEGKRFLKLEGKEASAVPLPITIQIGEDTYSLTPTEADASSKDFWEVLEVELKKQTRFFNADTFGTYLDEKVKQQALKLGEAIAPGMIQFENHLRTESLPKKKLTKTATINYLKTVAHNATTLKKELEGQSAKEAETKALKDMGPELLRFSGDNSRDTITHFQHSQHLDLHVRLQACLMETIRREFIQWKLAIESQAKSIGEGKLLLLTTAKHLLGVLDSEKLKMLALTEADEPLDQPNLTLPKLFITKLLQGHVCRCITCQPEVEAALKEEAIDSVKKSKQAEIEQDVVQSLIVKFSKQHEAVAKSEAIKRAKHQANTDVEREAEVARRVAVEHQIRASMTASVRQKERELEWSAAYRKQWENMQIPSTTPTPPMPETLKVNEHEAPTVPTML